MLMPQVRPSVGLPGNHCTWRLPGCRLSPCQAVCGGFKNPDSRISSPSVVIAASPSSSAPQFTTPPVFPSHPSAKGGRKDGAPSAGPDHASAALLPAVGWTAQRVVVKHIVRLHVEAGPVDQRDAG